MAFRSRAGLATAVAVLIICSLDVCLGADIGRATLPAAAALRSGLLPALGLGQGVGAESDEKTESHVSFWSQGDWHSDTPQKCTKSASGLKLHCGSESALGWSESQANYSSNASTLRSTLGASAVEPEGLEMQAAYLDLLLLRTGRMLITGKVRQAVEMARGGAPVANSRELKPVSFSLREDAGARRLMEMPPRPALVTSLRSFSLVM